MAKKVKSKPDPVTPPPNPTAESVRIRLACGCEFTGTRVLISECSKAVELRYVAKKAADKAAQNSKLYKREAINTGEQLIAHFKGERAS